MSHKTKGRRKAAKNLKRGKNMAALGVIGIIVALVFFIIMAMRGYSVLIIAPLTAIIIILTNQMNFTDAFFGETGSYLAGLAGFIRNNLLIFLLSAILGKYLDVSGAARSIANALMGKIGEDNPFLILVGVAAVGAILTYGGVSLFVVMFAMIPLSRPLFKAADLPWHLFVAPFALGCTGFTMTMLPGTPAAANVVAANYCGVTVTSAPILGILAAVIMIALSLVYFKRIVAKARANDEHYDCILPETEIKEDEALPKVGIALLPLILLILIIIVGSQFKVPNIVYIAMVIAILLCMILFHKFIVAHGGHRDTLGEGAKDSLGPTLFTAAGVGIGSVISASSGFAVLYAAIFNMPGGALVSGAVLAFILGGCLGSGTGALGIIGANFVADYLATGVSAAALYKVIAISATTGGALPNAGSMFGMLNAMGLNHKQAYKHFFWVDIVFSLAALIVVIILGSLVGGI